MSDIQNRADIQTLVDRFYERVKADVLLGPVFQHVDWPKHLPVMYDFWASMLLGEQSYRGNPFQRHLHLAIGPIHFERWLQLFWQTVDANFAGEKAEEAKSRARSIAMVWQHKMGLPVR